MSIFLIIKVTVVGNLKYTEVINLKNKYYIFTYYKYIFEYLFSDQKLYMQLT